MVQPGLLPHPDHPATPSRPPRPGFTFGLPYFQLHSKQPQLMPAVTGLQPSRALLKGVMAPRTRGCVARWQLYHRPLSPFERHRGNTRGDQSYAKSPLLEKQK